MGVFGISRSGDDAVPNLMDSVIGRGVAVNCRGLTRLKILLHSFTFWPNVGGIESVSHNLAVAWLAMGHQVTVLTEVQSSEERDLPYPVVRNAEPAQVDKLIAGHDILFSNGASMRHFFAARRRRKPFVWKHATYQLCSLDGFGWSTDGPTPLEPLPSLLHHLEKSGIGRTIPMAVRFGLRRLVANLVDANISVSNHQASRQPVPRLSVIYNPVDFDGFGVGGIAEAEALVENASHTFTFMGRLISEKGVDNLLRAFSQVAADDQGASPCTLKIIGDGPERGSLETLAGDLGIAHLVTFTGKKEGRDLVAEIKAAGICVVPSAWEEPMGLVTLELMAAGKPLIVSAVGGLSECGGDACISFPNRNIDALAQAMRTLAACSGLRRQLIERALARAAAFRAQSTPDVYIDLFRQILVERTPGLVAGPPQV